MSRSSEDPARWRDHALVVQWTERDASIVKVGGSTPPEGTLLGSMEPPSEIRSSVDKYDQARRMQYLLSEINVSILISLG